MASTYSSGFQAGTSTYTPYAQPYFQNVMSRGQDISTRPYAPYGGERVAPLMPSQLAAMQGIYGIQGYAEPYIQGAGALLQRAQAYADPSRYSQQALQQYYNPYQQDVVNATMANIAQENLRQQNDLTARAIQQGGFGSDRTGIARAELNRLQNIQNAQTLSGLQAQGYQQAQQQYNLAQQRAIEAAQSGAYSLGQLGLQGQQAGMQGIQALLGAGQMERDYAQQLLADQEKRYLEMMGYDPNMLAWWAAISGAIGPQMGGTQSTFSVGSQQQQTPSSNTLSSLLGLGSSLAGMGLKYFFPGAQAAKDGGRINKADGGSFGDLMSLGMEDPWYGFDPQRLDEEKKRQWLSRQDVDQTAKKQIDDRSWLNPDETYDPYQHDDVNYEDDGGPVLRGFGGRTGYAEGGSPYPAPEYLSGNYPGYIEKLKLPSPPSPHKPGEPPKVDLGSIKAENSDLLGDAAKSLGSLTSQVSKILSSRSSEPKPSEQQEAEQYGGRVTKADGGGFGDWLASLRAEQQQAPSYTAPTNIAPYMRKPQPAPVQQPMISNIGDLYKYALGREAEPEGLKYWQQQQQAGMSLGDIAKQFLGSTEATQKYAGADTTDLQKMFQNLTSSPATITSAAPQTYYTTGGAPIVNPDGTPVQFEDVSKPSAVSGTDEQGLYSEADIEAAGKAEGIPPGVILSAQQSGNWGLLGLAQAQAEQRQRDATAKAEAMRAHNAMIKQQPKQPMGYFMQLDPNVMVGGRFGFNIISPYYYPDTATANPNLNPYGKSWSQGGLVTEDKPKGFDLGGTASVGVGQLPNVMTGHGSQTNPSSFQPGYNPQAFYQQRADGGRTGYAYGGGHGDFYNSMYNAVLKAAKQQGAPHPEVLARLGAAQAAHESGWGKHAPNNNYFGIKGPGRSYATREVIGGKDIGTRASFRGYDSMQSSANDYVRLMANSPRYRNVFNADTPQKAFAAQSHSGYATDPNYGSKLAKADLIGSKSENIVAAAEPIRTLKTRPLTGERVGATPVKKGFNISNLNPIGTAQADEMPAPKKSFADAATEMRGGTGGYGPGIWEKDTPLTAFGETARKGDMPGDVPYAVTMAGAPFGPWDDGKGFTEGATAAAEDERPAKPVEPEKVAKQPAKAEEGPFYGDWRDYEPWKSDPIGGFIDELTGDVPKSRTKGKPDDMSSGPDIDLGGLADLFKGFSHGGRAHYADGGPTDVEDLDPELFSPEPMTESKGFEALADEEPAPKEVVSEDAATPAREAPRREASAPSGLGNLSSLGDALIAAGFGMMAGRSPNAWQNIGMGGLRGVEAYQSAEAIRARREGELAKVRQKEREAERSRDYLKDFLGAPSAEDYTAKPAKIEAEDTGKLDALYDELGRYQKAIAMAPDDATARRLRTMQENVKFQIQRAERAKSGGIGKIGTDELGNDIIGWTSGPRAGQPMKPETPASGVDWTQSGDAFLEQLPPGTASLVKSIAEGRADLPKGFGSAKTQPLFKMVTQYDPSFSMGEYQKRNQVLKQYADTSPTKAGGQLIAANTAISHAGTVLEAADRLGNVGFKPFNVAKHAFKSATTGDPAAVEFQQASEALNNELEKFFKGGSPADAAIRRAHENLNTAQTPQEYVAALHTMVELLHGRSNELKTRWDQTFKGKGGDIPIEDFKPISDRADEVTKRIENRYEQLTGKKPSVSATVSSRPSKEQILEELRRRQGVR